MGKFQDFIKNIEDVKISDILKGKGKYAKFIKWLIAFKILRTAVTLLLIFFYGSNLFS